MARVQLELVDADSLPPSCLRCGAPATHQVKLEFDVREASLQPWVLVPMCRSHRHHWRWRSVQLGLSLCAFLGIGFAGWLIVPWSPRWMLAVPPVIALALWTPLAYYLERETIQAVFLPVVGLELTGVAPEFVKALERQRQGADPPAVLNLTGKGTFDEIRLSRAELTGRLPAVCVVCGKPATCWRTRSFTGDNVLEAAPHERAVFVQIRASMCAPFCDTHRSHWWWRRAILWSGVPISLPLVLVFVGKALHWFTSPAAGVALGTVCIAALLTWFAGFIIAGRTGVRAIEVTRTGMTIKGVSNAFIEALENRRHERTGEE